MTVTHWWLIGLLGVVVSTLAFDAIAALRSDIPTITELTKRAPVAFAAFINLFVGILIGHLFW